MPEQVRSARHATRGADEPVQHFGAMLREFRETYFERISRKHGVPNVKMHLTALALIDCMREQGYKISSGAYSMVEAGATMPKDPRHFIGIVGNCLALDPDQARVLTEQVARDILRAKLGDDVASRAFPQARRT